MNNEVTHYQIDGRSYLLREASSHGVINTNTRELELARARRESVLALQNKVVSLEDRLARIEKMLSEDGK